MVIIRFTETTQQTQRASNNAVHSLLCHTPMQSISCFSFLPLIYKHSKSAGALLLHAESHMGPLIRGKSELKWHTHKARAVSCFTMASARSQELGQGVLTVELNKTFPNSVSLLDCVCICMCSNLTSSLLIHILHGNHIEPKCQQKTEGLLV